MTSRGWVERQTVTLAAEGGRLLARGKNGDTELFPQVRAVAFDYLLEPGLDSRWVTDWVSALSAPLAVRLRMTRVGGRVDTMLFPIKGRG